MSTPIDLASSVCPAPLPSSPKVRTTLATSDPGVAEAVAFAGAVAMALDTTGGEATGVAERNKMATPAIPTRTSTSAAPMPTIQPTGKPEDRGATGTAAGAAAGVRMCAWQYGHVTAGDF